jgi:hypothetical protein
MVDKFLIKKQDKQNMMDMLNEPRPDHSSENTNLKCKIAKL